MAMTLSGSSTTTTGVPNYGTSQNSTSGTVVDFTGIPSGIKRITVSFYNVSTNGTSPVQVQIGSGSFTTTGYSSHAAAIDGSGVGASTSGTGFLTEPTPTSAVFVRFGSLTMHMTYANTWEFSALMGISGSVNARVHMAGGAAPTLAGALDRVRITTVNGTDAFDSGVINIIYE